MTILDTHNTPKLSFLLVPKQETDLKQDAQENNILKLNDTSMMHMLPKGRIKMNQTRKSCILSLNSEDP